MAKVSGLGAFFAPGSADAVNRANDAIDNTLAYGSDYFNSGDMGLSTPGTQGNALVNGIAQLGQMQVGVNTGAMDRDSAALRGLADQHYGLAQTGGMAESAARQQALSDIANLGQGGAGAGQAINDGSRELTNQATNVALSERSQNAQGSTKMDSSAAAAELQKVLYEATVSHANHATALASRAYQTALQNMQSGHNLDLNAAATAARNGQAVASQQASDTVRRAALSAATSIAATAGTALATAASMGKVTPQPYTRDASGNVGGIRLGVPSGSGGMTGASSAVLSQPSTAPVPTVNPFYPNAAGNTVMGTDTQAWGKWLTGSNLAP